MSNGNAPLRLLEPAVRPGGLAFPAKPRVGPIESQSFEQVLESVRQVSDTNADAPDQNKVTTDRTDQADHIEAIEAGGSNRVGLVDGLDGKSGLSLEASRAESAATLQIMVDQLSQVDRIENAALRQIVAGAMKPDT